MTDVDRYLFDLQGYVHLPGFLSVEQAQRLLVAVKALEVQALACREDSPRFLGNWGMEYWRSREFGYYAHGRQAPGKTLMIEDFWLYPDAFDWLVGHEPTMACIRRVVQGAIAINNSEVRIRYPQNHTGMKMGFPGGHAAKYAYNVVDGDIHCMLVRMVYFLHDVPLRNGPLCFVPGSHKGAFHLPGSYADPIDEPGVVGVPVKAGDAILFTEAVRHGGLRNVSDETRYTIHIGYGPAFLGSQNISTMDERPNAPPAFLNRLSEEQRKLFYQQQRQSL